MFLKTNGEYSPLINFTCSGSKTIVPFCLQFISAVSTITVGRMVHLTSARLFLVLCIPWMTSSQTAPPYCSFQTDRFVCQYASMPLANRPIDYSQFSIPPQILEVSANGFLPYFGKQI